MADSGTPFGFLIKYSIIFCSILSQFSNLALHCYSTLPVSIFEHTEFTQDKFSIEQYFVTQSALSAPTLLILLSSLFSRALMLSNKLLTYDALKYPQLTPTPFFVSQIKIFASFFPSQTSTIFWNKKFSVFEIRNIFHIFLVEVCAHIVFCSTSYEKSK